MRSMLPVRGLRRSASWRRARAGALLALGLTLVGCPRESLTHFPTLTGTTCRVELGMPREHVLLRCGPPCGGGPVGAGLSCDVYGSAEICYRDGAIVSLQRLGSWGDRFPWCGWGEDGAPTEAP
ncbi:MAG TPA: hypothetical protein VK013_08135 [Myxococcaceae bacterium]|nr:hypothetical protein [Myxococcaceae bacterium]